VYDVAYTGDAAKALRRMPRNVAQRIMAKIAALAEAPRAANRNVKALKGREGYRLRVGDWRVLYRLEDDRKFLEVLVIAPRGSAYR
jgi:mRNA interferase RelE/StbE